MKNLLNALSAFQKEVPIIHKNTKGYSYTYADLSQIIEKITPVLKKHELGFYQAVHGTQLKTVIFHSSGDKIEECADIPQGVNLKGMNEFQVLGSAITYMRRYQLSAMLGIVTDADLDAAGEQVKPAIKLDSKEFNEAVKYLANGGKINVIENKYDITKVKDELLSRAMG